MNIALEIDPGRLVYGLSRIGYTTSSAICDIIDNSARAKASEINVLIIKENENYTDARKNNVKEYIIIDNGVGMDEDGLKNALTLGASDEYEPNSLSKFGLGLKSAAFSQADELIVISSKGGVFVKFEISLSQIINQKKYFATKTDLTEMEKSLISKYLPENRGTIVKLASVRKTNHPSVKNTLSDLKQKIGVIYYYFLKNGVQINIENYAIKAFDPLFTDDVST